MKDETPNGAKAPGIRARARRDMERQILDTARQELAAHGPAGLSLRAISRAIGMSSSAIYVYVKSRDELLTMLIIDSYNSLGQAAENAEATVDRANLRGRLLAIAEAARLWALAHQQEFALIFGTPVPGYSATPDTEAAATRIPYLLLQIGRQSLAEAPEDREKSGDPTLAEALAPLEEFLQASLREEHPYAGGSSSLPTEKVARGLIAWTHLVGAVSFELFGHRSGTITNTPELRSSFFDYEMGIMADLFLG